MDLLDITRTAHSPVSTLRMGGHEFSVSGNNFSLPANHNEKGGANRPATRLIAQFIDAYHAIDFGLFGGFCYLLSLFGVPSDSALNNPSGQLCGLTHANTFSPIGIATKIDLWKNKEVNSQFACFFNISAGFFQGLFLVKEVWRNLSCAYVYSSHIEMRPYK